MVTDFHLKKVMNIGKTSYTFIISGHARGPTGSTGTHGTWAVGKATPE